MSMTCRALDLTQCELDQALTEARANCEAPSLGQVCLPAKSIPKLADWKVKEANQS